MGLQYASLHKITDQDRRQTTALRMIFYEGRCTTPTFITLIRSTQQGMQNIKQSLSRLEAAKRAFKAIGAELKQFYLDMGQYDMVIIGEVSDDERAAKLSLAIGSQGAIRTESMRAFTEEEYRKVVEALPRPYMTAGGQGSVAPSRNSLSGLSSTLWQYLG